jgi:hypothetical protein
MPEIDIELAHFFAWARARAYEELDDRMKADPEADPNWTFSDIMQELMEEYRRLHVITQQKEERESARAGERESGGIG